MVNVKIVDLKEHDVINGVVYSIKKRSSEDMEGIYTSYLCTGCKKQFVLITEEIESMSQGKYLACPYCGCRHIKKQSIGDSLKECMKESSYKRVHGSLRQVR